MTNSGQKTGLKYRNKSGLFQDRLDDDDDDLSTDSDEEDEDGDGGGGGLQCPAS